MTYDPRRLGARCDICPLAGQKVVPPTRATSTLKLIIVGEGPGYNEERERRPFVGISGKMLDRVLSDHKFSRANAHVTNAFLCKTDDKRVKPVAAACCAPRLGREISKLDPAVPVLGLGATVVKPLLGKAGIFKVRGFVWTAPQIGESHLKNALRNLAKRKEKGNAAKIEAAEWSLSIVRGRRRLSGRTMLFTVHPAFLLRGADQWTPVFRLDIGRAVKWAKEGPFPLEDNEPYTVTALPKKAARILKKMGPMVSLDLETNGVNPLKLEITMIGISDCTAPGVGTDLVLSPWRPDLVPVLNEALKNRIVQGHNLLAFDKIACKQHGIIWTKEADSLIAHHAAYGHFPRSLAHVGSVFCEISPWKSRFKDGEKGVANYAVATEELERYNAADVRIALRSWNRMWAEMLEQDKRVYRTDMRVAQLCADMQMTGLLLDDERRLDVAAKLRRKARRLKTKMRVILRRKLFDPKKPNHIRHAIYKVLRVPINRMELTDTGLPTTAAAFLEARADSDTRVGHFCRALIDWRSSNDTVGEYLDGPKFRETILNGVVHSEWRSYGTEVGRPATHRPNVLNMPRLVLTERAAALLKGKNKDEQAAIMKRLGRDAYDPATRVREIYVARPGRTFVYFDLSQSQMRQAAHLSGDRNFIETCKGDVHGGNARLFFPQVDAAMKADPGFLKGAGKVYRDVCKSLGFAILFLAEEEKVYMTLVAAGFGQKEKGGFCITPQMVRVIIQRIRSKYAQYAAYVARNIALCQKQGYLRSPYAGRIRRMGHYPKPTTVANFPVIAGEADCMMERLLEIEDQRPSDSPLVFWGYDSAIYECPSEDVGTDDKGLPTGPMADIIRKTWDRPILVPHNGIEFKQPIDLKIGHRLSDL